MLIANLQTYVHVGFPFYPETLECFTLELIALVNAEDKQSSWEVCVVWLGIEQFPESGADAAFKDLRTLAFFGLEGTRITKNERIAIFLQ